MKSHDLSDDKKQELTIGYVLGSLSQSETEEFEEYLRHDASLVAQMQECEQLMGLMAHAAPQIAAPQSLRDRVMADISTPEIRTQGKKSRRWGWEKIAAGIAAVFIGGLGLQNHLLLQELVAHQAEDEEQTTFTFSLTKAESRIPAGEIVLDLEMGRAVFAIQNLPALKTGETYTLWAFTEDEPILCGSFAPTQTGQVVTQMALPIDEYGSPIVSMRIFKSNAALPSDLSNSVPIMASHV